LPKITKKISLENCEGDWVLVELLDTQVINYGRRQRLKETKEREEEAARHKSAAESEYGNSYRRDYKGYIFQM